MLVQRCQRRALHVPFGALARALAARFWALFKHTLRAGATFSPIETRACSRGLADFFGRIGVKSFDNTDCYFKKRLPFSCEDGVLLFSKHLICINQEYCNHGNQSLLEDMFLFSM